MSEYWCGLRKKIQTQLDELGKWILAKRAEFVKTETWTNIL